MRAMIWNHPKTVFNEELFLKLLRSSLTLTLPEKLRILKKLPVLDQDQLNHLTNMLVQEQEKFEFISENFPSDVATLVAERMEEIESAINQRNLLEN